MRDSRRDFRRPFESGFRNGRLPSFPLRRNGIRLMEKTYPRNSVCLLRTRPITGYGYYLKINPGLFTEVFPETFSVFYSGIFSVFYSGIFHETFPESSEEIFLGKYGKFRREFFQEKVSGIRKVLFLISEGDLITVLPLRSSARLRVCPAGTFARRRAACCFFGLRLKKKTPTTECRGFPEIIAMKTMEIFYGLFFVFFFVFQFFF